MSANNISTNELLDRYVNGSITAPQEAELERRAAEDPVLAEALEGLSAFPEAAHEARVEQMVARTQAAVPNTFGGQGKVRQGRVRPLGRLMAAASILLLLAVAIFLLPRFSGSSADLAMKEEVPAPGTAQVPETKVVELSAAEPEMPAAEGAATPAGEDNAAAVPARVSEPSVESIAAAPPAATRAEDLLADDLPPAPAAAGEQPASRPETPVAVAPLTKDKQEAQQLAREHAARAAAERQRQEMMARRERAAAKKNQGQIPRQQAGTLSGRITNERGDPIVGALIRLPGLPIGERTDSNGVFQLDVDATTSRIEVSHPEYEEESFDLRNQGDDVQISLEDREEKKDYQAWTNSWNATKIPISTEPGYALPEEGYNALRRRIEENRPENVPLGQVKLSFTVNPDGTMEDFVFKGRPSQETMDYVGGIIARTSIWEVRKGDKPVRVYFKVVFK